VRINDVVFVEDQTIEDIVKTKEKFVDSIPVGVPHQRHKKIEMILTHVLQIQLNKNLNKMMQKMCTRRCT
jgi:hypothetical protein